jgi:hypothetical protein
MYVHPLKFVLMILKFKIELMLMPMCKVLSEETVRNNINSNGFLWCHIQASF